MIDLTHLIFAASNASPSLGLCALSYLAQNTSGVCTDRLLGIRVQEGYQEERYVVLPRNASIRRKVDGRDEVAIAVRSVRDEQFLGIHGIVYVPAAV